MRWPRVAINATVFATTVRVERIAERDIGRIVLSDDAFRALLRDGGFEYRRISRLSGLFPSAIIEGFALPFFETAFEIEGGTAAFVDLVAVKRNGMVRMIHNRHRHADSFRKTGYYTNIQYLKSIGK
jgi:hypothetical protein